MGVLICLGEAILEAKVIMPEGFFNFWPNIAIPQEKQVDVGVLTSMEMRRIL